MDAVLGTAGHIDHGKTSLVRALTGINCDRLDEEKRRGITIDLGFAWLDLPDGRRLGIIDVPGHERFVKTMVAGAAGIDCMLLVIAADEGVMPQTREHLDICSLLGVRSGIVALTKTDIVDEDWLQMVTEDVKDNLRGTFLEGAPIIPVSSANGNGIGALRTAVIGMGAALEGRQRTDLLRLPVDRVFTLKGFGTVVTGTLVSGLCKQGEDISIFPAGKQARVRSIQVHGNQVQEGRSGQRCAMNLQGVEVDEIQRGDIIGRPNTLFPSKRWIIHLSCLSSAPHPIRQRMEVHFHHGSRESSAKIIFRDRDDLKPGKSAIAELYLSQAIAGVFGDHCVLRAHSPLRTIAGGTLIDPLPPVLRARDPLFGKKFSALEELARLAEKNRSKLSSADARELVSLALSLRDMPGADEKRLTVLTGLPSNVLEAALKKTAEKGQAICWDSATKSWVDKDVFDASLDKCLERSAELHEREPLMGFFAQNALCSGWGDNLPSRYTQKVLDRGIKRGHLKEEGNGLKLASWEVKPDADQSEIMTRLQDMYEKSGLTPPTLKEVQETLSADLKQIMSILAHLCENGHLVRIQEGFYYDKAVLDDILQKVRKWFANHDNLDVGAMKTIFGISRKFAIPLLEYLDSIGITYRVGNQRQLRKTGN